jgi:hypothetical protein
MSDNLAKPDKTSRDDRAMAASAAPLDEIVTSYNRLHASIVEALRKATDADTVTDLLLQDKAAYAAYRSALAGALAPGDAAVQRLLKSLKSTVEDAEAGIAKVDKDIKKIADVVDKIGKAAGILAKIAALAA